MASGTQRTIEVFGTSIMSSNKIRSNHDKVTRILTQAKVRFDFHDIGSSEDLKLRFKKIVASNHIKSGELPLVLSGGEVVGTVDQLEEAVECGELRQFLLLDKPVGHSQDDELLNSLSPAQIKELDGELSTSTDRAHKVAAEAQDLSGKGQVEKPIEPTSTPSNLPPSLIISSSQKKPDEHAVRQGESSGLSSQMLVGKDEVQLKKDHDLERAQEQTASEEREKDLPSLDATSTSVDETIRKKVEANPDPTVLL